MEPEEKTRLLSMVSLFESLSREEIEILGRKLPDMRLDRGQMLYTPDYRGRIVFLLLRGRVLVYRVVGTQEFILGMAGAGEMIGKVAFADRRPQGAYAQAMEPSEVAMLGNDTLRRLVYDNPEVGLKAMELLSESLSSYEDRMADIGLKEVSARLAGLVLRLVESEGVVTVEGYKIPTHYSHEQLGAMIGARRVAVTRALGELRKAGAVELRQRLIYVRDAETLKRVARIRPTAETWGETGSD